MPGGLMSLVAVGAQNLYVTGSPEFTYFRQIYKRHTNFSMESRKQIFNTDPYLGSGIGTNIFTCKIQRLGDLLSDVVFAFKLPDIYSDGLVRFRWISNFANYMIYRYQVSIGTSLIDQKWGQWLDIWNDLTLSEDKKYTYSRMTGNIDNFIAPRLDDPIAVLNNNKIEYIYYPDTNLIGGRPSIKGKQLYLPLNFWFSKNPALAVPLVALQYQVMTVQIELRGIESLYQVYDQCTGEYISSTEFNNRVQTRLNNELDPFYKYTEILRSQDIYSYINDVNLNINTFLNNPSQNNVISLQSYLECNYIYLDNDERRILAMTNTDFLIEKVTMNEIQCSTQQTTVDVVLNNLVKEMIWVLRRADSYTKYNNFDNFTAFPDNNDQYPILKTAKIIWNGMDRIEEKPAEYFNLLQIYNHHTCGKREGIYAYSYALTPEKLQPSGVFNASMVNKVQLYLNTNIYTLSNDGISFEPSIDNYIVDVYAIQYNIFRVMSGNGSLVFVT